MTLSKKYIKERDQDDKSVLITILSDPATRNERAFTVSELNLSLIGKNARQVGRVLLRLSEFDRGDWESRMGLINLRIDNMKSSDNANVVTWIIRRKA